MTNNTSKPSKKHCNKNQHMFGVLVATQNLTMVTVVEPSTSGSFSDSY